VACPSCGKELPGPFPFCPYCGASTVDAQGAATIEERKVVSVLFCDLVGFTAASDDRDPEDVRARLRPYHTRVRQEIERHGGTVEKYVGDAVMAVFGAPVAHEDDAERAVRAALHVVSAISELNDADPLLELQVRLGVNTGEAVVAVDARPEMGEGMVTGDVVNTAARIQSVAPVDGVAVSEQTHRATNRVFDYDPLDAVTVKGKAAPLQLWRAKTARGRFGSDIGRHRTPLVGRELERPLLIGTFERAAQQRSVQLVTIVGEPGVGKSRLAAELFSYVDGKPGLFRWRQGRCLPYGDGITFWALGEIVKAEAGILESDSADTSLGKLGSILAADERDRQWLLDRLAPLLGIEPATSAERQELFAAWRRFIEGLALARPTVLVFEDLHWADGALLDFLEHLMEWLHEVPLLVVCTARPELYEQRRSWATGLRNSQTINLTPLTDAETARLVSYLLTGTTLSPEFERAILLRAGGNPLYAEEFVRYLADRSESGDEGVIADSALPETVHALIAARLDTLPPDRKSLLQDAAVLGKVFWSGALAETGGRSLDEVEIALHELGRKELVRPNRVGSMEGEQEYSFWHLLVRDVAYAQIPRADRARRHRRAAEWLERKAQGRVEDLAEVLAHHYLRALELSEAAGAADDVEGLRGPARRFLALSGERALGLDTLRAETRLARALELTRPAEPEHARLLLSWADAASQAGHPLQAAEALERATEALLARGETETAALALQLRSRIALRLGADAVSLAAEAVQLLEGDVRSPALVAAYTQLASAQSLKGSYRDAIAAADRAEELAADLALPDPIRALGYRGYARALHGDAGGLGDLERALELLIQEGAGREAAAVQNNLAIARYPFEGPGPSLSAFEQGMAFCRERGIAEGERTIGANCPGLLAELGRVDEALDQAARLAQVIESTGDVRTLIELRATQLGVRVSRGEVIRTAEPEWLFETARAVAAAEIVALAFGPAAAGYAHADPKRARMVLGELAEWPGVAETPYYGRTLPLNVRTALALDDAELARTLAGIVKRRYPLQDHALHHAYAQVAEHDRDYKNAAAGYAGAADRWKSFGNLPEHAYALLGQGRCLAALGEAEAEPPLVRARDLFAALAFAPAYREAAAHIKGVSATLPP
jgi:class 3 adenylate cyclase